MSSGERYDVVVHANQPGEKYWILAKTLEAEDALQSVYRSPVDKHKAEAILVYGDPNDHSLTPSLIRLEQSSTWNCSISSPCTVVNCLYTSNSLYTCINVESFINLATSSSFDKALLSPIRTLFYNFGFNGEKSMAASSLDGINFRFPVTILSSNIDKKQLMAYGKKEDLTTLLLITVAVLMLLILARVRNLDISDISMGDVVKIVLINMPGDGYTGDPESSHPVHLHGHSFYVIEVGYPTYNEGSFSPQNDNICCTRQDQP